MVNIFTRYGKLQHRTLFRTSKCCWATEGLLTVTSVGEHFPASAQKQAARCSFNDVLDAVMEIHGEVKWNSYKAARSKALIKTKI